MRRLSEVQNAVFITRSSKRLHDDMKTHKSLQNKVYEQLILECKHGTDRKSSSTGVRANQRSLKINCKARLHFQLKKFDDTWKLAVVDSHLEHENHVPSQESVSVLPEKRRIQMTKSVIALLKCPSVTSKDLRTAIAKEQNIKLFPKDICNLRVRFQKECTDQESVDAVPHKVIRGSGNSEIGTVDKENCNCTLRHPSQDQKQHPA